MMNKRSSANKPCSELVPSKPLYEFQTDEPFPLVQLVLSVHTLYNLPPELGRLDPRYEQLEIVLWPVVKYTYRERRVAHVPLAEHVFPFSVTAMVIRGNTCLIDFDMAKKDAVSESSTSLSSFRMDSAEAIGCDQAVVVRGSSATLQFPCPAGMRATVLVSGGIRQRRLGFSAARWLTTNINPRPTSDGIGIFSVATEEVYRTKLVTRVVGHSIGAMICSVGVSQFDGRSAITRRLLRDKERFMSLRTAQQPLLEKVNVEAMLKEGFSEQLVYRHMLLLVDRDYYKRRLEALFAMYDVKRRPTWWRESLLHTDFILREDELIRRLYVEVGPECSTTSPRYRLWAFRKKYSLTEANIVTCLRPVLGSSIGETLATDPGAAFAALTHRVGCEPLPTAYLFPQRVYEKERRAFIFEAFAPAANRFTSKHSDKSPHTRSRRLPFTASPHEQPLERNNAESYGTAVVSEVDVLREKHASEFSQIIPPIAAALRAVVEQNGRLPQEQQDKANAVTHVLCERQLSPQGSFHDFMHRVADTTFISPATLVGASILLDRLCMQRPDLFITEYNATRLFLTSTRVVSKVLELRSVSNRCFANSFGLNTKTLNRWEEFFIKGLKFDLSIKPQEFREYTNLLSIAGATQVGPVSTPTARFLVGADDVHVRTVRLPRKPELTTAPSCRTFPVPVTETPHIFDYGKRYPPRTEEGTSSGSSNGETNGNVRAGGSDANIRAFRGLKSVTRDRSGSLNSFEAGIVGYLSCFNVAGSRRSTEPVALPRKVTHSRNVSGVLTATKQGA